MKYLWIVLGVLVILVTVAGLWAYLSLKPDKNLISEHIQENRDNSAILLLRNDSVLVELNPDKKMPLASTAKIILAIEYAQQAAAGFIDPDSLIALKDLAVYYVPGTDGDAHPNWLEKMRNDSLIQNKSVSLHEVAKGMMRFSSNANTEYLMDRLGLDKINANLEALRLAHHDLLYPFVSALFVSKELPKAEEEAQVEQIRSLSRSAYIDLCNQIHQKLKTDYDSAYKHQLDDISMDLQKVWSDRLPAASVRDYVSVMKKINNRNYFPDSVQTQIEGILEWVMNNETNQQWLAHAGMKGGSTAFVLTKALYATDKKGNTTELAYFFNNLGYMNNLKLQANMNQFELNILTQPEFREKLKQTFSEIPQTAEIFTISVPHE